MVFIPIKPSRTKNKNLYNEMENRINLMMKHGRVSKDMRRQHKGFPEWKTESTSRDHPAIVQILIDDKEQTALDEEGINLPTLVYMSREKRSHRHHNFKAGAMNSLMNMIKVSNIMGIESKPFDPRHSWKKMCLLQMNLEVDVFVIDESGANKRIHLEDNIVRYRRVKNRDGTTSATYIEERGKLSTLKDTDERTIWTSDVIPLMASYQKGKSQHSVWLGGIVTNPIADDARSTVDADPSVPFTQQFSFRRIWQGKCSQSAANEVISNSI